MRVYECWGHPNGAIAVGTLQEARVWARELAPMLRFDAEVKVAEIDLHKENVLRLVNNTGGTHRYTGEVYAVTPRGGLKREAA